MNARSTPGNATAGVGKAGHPPLDLCTSSWSAGHSRSDGGRVKFAGEQLPGFAGMVPTHKGGRQHVPTLQIKKLRPGEVKWPARGHLASLRSEACGFSTFPSFLGSSASKSCQLNIPDMGLILSHARVPGYLQ